MRLLTTLFLSFSLISCAAIERPNTDLCVVNAPGETRKCYNLKRDYNDNGELKRGAKATYKTTKTVEDLNKNTCTDVDGLQNLKAYISTLREICEARRGD